MKQLLTLLSVSLLICCTQKNVIEEGEIIKIPNTSPCLLTDIAEEFHVVSLENTEESITAYVTSLRVTNGHIFTLDNISTQKFLMYDMKGKFIKQIGQRGRSNKEYIEAESFEVDHTRGELILQDVGNNKLLIFDINGNYLRTIPIELPFMNVAPLSNGEFALAYSPTAYYRFGEVVGDYKIMKASADGKIRTKEYVDDLRMKFGIQFINYITSHHDGSVTMSPQYSYEILSITPDSIKRLYKIEPDFKVLTKDDIKRMDTHEQYRDSELNGKSLVGGAHAISPTHLYLQLGFLNKEQVFYNKNTQNVIRVKDDLCGKCITVDEDGYFWGVISVASLRDDPRKEAQRILSEANNMENHVLVRYKLKDF